MSMSNFKNRSSTVPGVTVHGALSVTISPTVHGALSDTISPFVHDALSDTISNGAWCTE